MSRSRVSMLEMMRKIIEPIRPRFIRAGLKENHLDFPDGCEVLGVETIREALQWLMALDVDVFKKVRRAWGLCSEETWDYYFVLGDCQDLREMKILKSVLVRLRKQLNTLTRPDFFKKGKRNAALKKAKKSDKRK